MRLYMCASACLFVYMYVTHRTPALVWEGLEGRGALGFLILEFVYLCVSVCVYAYTARGLVTAVVHIITEQYG